jgi:hypothetical protein
MNLWNWIYVSRSCIGSTNIDDEIARLVQQARSKNERLQVTGVLVFDGTYFAQFVEGPKASMQELRSLIEADSRHQDVTTISHGVEQSRQLADWTLGYSGRSLVISRAIRRALRDVQQQDPAAGTRLSSMFTKLAGSELLSSTP